MSYGRMEMMQIHRSLIVLALVAVGLVLVGCNLPASTEPPPLDESAASTAGAETIIAQLTVVVETLTPEGIESPAPEPTQTPVLSDPTDTAEPTTAPTEAPTELPATATSTAAPTPTLDANDPRAGLGDAAFSDSFSDGSNWPLYTDDHVSFEVKDSKLMLTAFNPDKYNGWMLTWPVVSDFYIEMLAETKQCSGKDQFGVMVRAVKTEKGYIGYLYGVSCDGHYSLRRWDGQKYVQLIDWTPSEQLNAGANQTNRIGLMANGNKFSLYGNGKLIGEYQDDTHPEGRFGVFIGSAATSNVQVLVDEIAYWDLP